MMEKRIVTFIFFILLAQYNYGQIIKIKGSILDAQSSEVIRGAHIISSVDTAFSNIQGDFIINGSPRDSLIISHTGYKSYKWRINISTDSSLVLFLEKIENVLDEVLIIEARNKHLKSQFGTTQINLPIGKINTNPVILGERDVLKFLQLIPGVSGSAEGQANLIVRGGNYDQNLFLFENSSLYNPNHIFGFVSVFDPDLLKNVEIYKSNIPVEYSGKVSSLVNMQVREGDLHNYSAKLNIGILSSKFLIEGPIRKGNSSFIFSARKSLIEEVLLNLYKRFNTTTNNFKNYHVDFYDLNFKANFQINNNNKLVIHHYSGSDFYSRIDENNSEATAIKNTNKGNWSNKGTSLAWYQNVNKFSNSYIFDLSSYDYNNITKNETKDLSDNFNSINVNQNLGIKDYSFRYIGIYNYSPAIRIKYGAYIINHHLNQGSFDIEIKSEKGEREYTVRNKMINSIESAIFSGIKINPFPKVMLSGGVNLSNYLHQEQRDFILQPRLLLQYQLNNALNLFASGSRNAQFIQTLGYGRFGFPNEIWVNSRFPLTSLQYDVGGNFESKFLNVGLSIYYKTLNNLTNLGPGKSIISNDLLEDKIIFGKGRTYGVELLVQQEVGKITNELSYTLGYTEQKFDELEQGAFFPSRHDKRHHIFYTLNYNISPKLDISCNWQFSTGAPIQIRKGAYSSLLGQYVEIFTDRGEIRQRNFHVGNINFHYKWGLKYKKELSLSIYNIYNRKNPFFTREYYENSYNEGIVTTQLKLQNYSLFPIIPSINYSIQL